MNLPAAGLKLDVPDRMPNIAILSPWPHPPVWPHVTGLNVESVPPVRGTPSDSQNSMSSTPRPGYRACHLSATPARVVERQAGLTSLSPSDDRQRPYQ